MHRPATSPPLSAVAVIPSRYGAERFPGKPLHPLLGIPMVVRVMERALAAKSLDAVLVATDDDRIARAVEAAGGKAVMTDPRLASGTDRVWAAVKDLDVAVVLNVQGDEPMMDAGNIDRVARFLLEHPEFPLATVALPITDADDIANPNNVKVVRGDDGRALYFSRSAIPHRRRTEPGLPTLKHLGLYGYRKEALRKWTRLPQHPLERAESLEQLRALAAGMQMAVLDATADSIGVDTPEDAERVEDLLRNQKEHDERAGSPRMAGVKGALCAPLRGRRPLTPAIRGARFQLSAAAVAAAAYKKEIFGSPAAVAAAAYEKEIFGSPAAAAAAALSEQESLFDLFGGE